MLSAGVKLKNEVQQLQPLTENNFSSSSSSVDCEESDGDVLPSTSISGPVVGDLSRRKQRNPKPFFSCEHEALTKSQTEELEDDENPLSMVKVEVVEGSVPICFSPSPKMPLTIADFANSNSSVSQPPAPPSFSAEAEEILSKNNMLYFGDVIHSPSDHQTEGFPIPLLIPMVYLYPFRREGESPEGISRYRMFIPMGMAEPLPIPSPSVNARQRKESLNIGTVGSPLDLRKSPTLSPDNNVSDVGLMAIGEGGVHIQQDIEAHLNMLRSKHMVLIQKSQTFRCQECNINFSKHQNYLAHKKYYCTAGEGKLGNGKSSRSTSINEILDETAEQEQNAVNKDCLINKKLLMATASFSTGASQNTNCFISSSSQQHFTCDGCGIKFKSITNLQAHQARYCVILRKTNADAFSTSKKSNSNRAMPSSDDFCCILCGFKEQSIDRLKDHINMHFIGQIKRGGVSNVTLSPPPSSNIDQTLPQIPVLDGYDQRSSKRLKITNEPSSISKSNSTSSGSINLTQKQTPPLEEVGIKDEPGLSDENKLYCNICNIKFSQIINFKAHKKYYCMKSTTSSSLHSP